MLIFLWFLVMTAVLLLAQKMIYQRFALQKVSYSRRFSRNTCFRGEEMTLIEQLANRKWLPVPWVSAESQLSAHLQFRTGDNFAVSSGSHYQNHKSFFSLKPQSKITRTHWITPQRRGWYRLHTVSLTSGDLLDIGRSVMQLPLSSELIVYPRPADVDMGQLPQHSWQGDVTVRRFIVPDPFVIAGARPYQAGDSYKMVNWKATARAGSLQVHQYDYTADRRLLVYLNVDDGEGMWRSVSDVELIEYGIEWAAGAVNCAIEGGMEAGFTANMPLEGEADSVRIEPSGGHEQLYMIFEAMAKLLLERTEPFHMLLQRGVDEGYRDRDVLIISSYWNDELEAKARLLRLNGNAVAVWELRMKEGRSDTEREGQSA
ncbi:DUF58 domain-containing protein [Paenibacillus sp. J5C_2022]|uniref:DUF58 domain-containing protein n=1 Tax=Paenibacillus sp. J5C2022 TaxID=2977129 RepID=UPI0021CE05E9|nr:DUF58 domain-containing protein [Paenibacillus sp. J5C2022]MCU6708162.1 DUF58 domain-containing protein [Paenibacillus sp. J5C2022]